LILDRAGQEVGRVVGPAEWDASEVIEFIKPIIAKQTVPIEGRWPGRAISRPSHAQLAMAQGTLRQMSHMERERERERER
jgi:hypothetical protein